MPGKLKQIKKTGTSPSRTEDWFETILRSSEGSGLSPYQREYMFHPTRKWRWDFCWVKQKVAIEIQGGTWNCGAHTRGKGYQEDCDKHNEAVRLGWKVLNFTTVDIMKRPVKCLKLIRNVLELS